MGTTPTYLLPYPEATDPADVPLDMRELAERIEAVFPGKELAYAQITALASITATTEATAQAVVTAPAVTFDGSPVLIEFGCEGINPASVAGASITLWLYQDGASIGVLGTMNNPAAGTSRAPVRPARRLTPTPGSHTYSVRATVSTGTGQILAGPGGAAQDAPAFIRITRV